MGTAEWFVEKDGNKEWKVTSMDFEGWSRGSVTVMRPNNKNIPVCKQDYSSLQKEKADNAGTFVIGKYK